MQNAPRVPNSAGANTANLQGVSDFIQAADVGLAMYDADLNLVACNNQYQTLYGLNAENLVTGTPLLEILSLVECTEDENLSDAINQITLILQGAESDHSLSAGIQTKDARFLDVSWKFLPTGSLVETVRERLNPEGSEAHHNNTQKMVETAREHMMHALDGMADGFSIYDKNDRLVIYNRQYIELNPHIADLIKPGVKFGEMLREGVERAGFNTGPMSKDAFYNWRMDLHNNPAKPYDIQLADGRWIRVHEKRTDDGSIVGILSDITELKRRESDILKITQELRGKNIQFDTALNHMIQGLCMFDDEQILLVCNKRYLDMYGFDPDIVKPGIKLRDIMLYSVSIGNYTEEDAARAIAARPDQAKLRERATLKQYLRDGRVIAVMHQPMPNGDSIATYQDITDLERQEIRLREYTQKLEISNRELQDFAHVASHDLQEPLRKIEAFGGRLAKKYGDTLPEDGQVFIDRMQNAAGRMRCLINDLLNFSRITTKAQPFLATNLNEVLDGVLSDLQIAIEESDAILNIEELPTIDADASQMRQLFQNIIGNALKFTKPDCQPVVTVKAVIEQKNVNGEKKDECLLTIADNGIGFDNQYAEQIFTIFQRLHGRSEYEGTGIGLATCRKIVERHNGAIMATSTQGEGAKFEITLPVDHE